MPRAWFRSAFFASPRDKEIRYSSRKRLNLLTKLPAELLQDADVAFPAENFWEAAVTIVHLFYRSHPYEDHPWTTNSRACRWTLACGKARLFDGRSMPPDSAIAFGRRWASRFPIFTDGPLEDAAPS